MAAFLSRTFGGPGILQSSQKVLHKTIKGIKMENGRTKMVLTLIFVLTYMIHIPVSA